MARNCGCAGSSCGCSIVSGSAAIHINGIGSAKDPFTISIDQLPISGALAVTDTSTVDLTLAGSGTVLDPYVLSAVTLSPVTTGNWNSTVTGVTIGTAGTDVGTYRQAGKHVRAERTLTLGSAAFAVTAVSILLPVPLAAVASARGIIGWATYYDASATALFYGPIFGNGDATTGVLRTGAQPALPLGAAAPFTWAAGDQIVVELDYLVA